MSFLLGHASTSYTHHPSPISLPLKSSPSPSLPLPTLIQQTTPPCRLNPLLFNGHLQTMYTALKSPGPPIHYKRKLFSSTHPIYPGTFAVDFVTLPPSNPEEIDATLPERTTRFSADEEAELGGEDEKPMLVCLHGLTGGSHEVYLREVLAQLVEDGAWAACVVNGRGCAMSEITSPQLFNARATWDVRQTVQFLLQKFPNRALYGVGYSLGANILTNYVGEEGSGCVFRAAVACSNPWNLEVCHHALMRSWVGREVYSKTMGGNMMGLFARHKEQILRIEGIDEEVVITCKHLYEFDRWVRWVIQAPTWGYPTEGAYYRDAQSVDAISAIRIPFLGINAEDDPISHIEAIPFEEFKRNPYTVLCTTNWGGHLSWFQTDGKRWFATAIAAFFARMHQDIDHDAAKEHVEANGSVEPSKKYPIWDPSHRRLTVPLS
ncbi:carboxylesterase-like protein [Polyplosphaeria fusca]|uniref:alcohol O-acetyltransferase n=1 Tax=Polyplosphaeria fusca TaxID=682080 RepID=A0A9P4QRQ2_9PLEO|nr:carboxylesterase-like protein [Polyplosphaeria fusca]